MGECMKVEYVDNRLIVYLKETSVDDIEDLCQDLIEKLGNYFNIELKGFYDVYVYIDKRYGIVLEFIMEELDIYIDFSKAELHLIENNNNFLYEIFDILDVNVNKFYLYNGRYYITLDNVDNSNIEFGRIIYKNTEDIINNGKMILV